MNMRVAEKAVTSVAGDKLVSDAGPGINTGWGITRIKRGPDSHNGCRPVSVYVHLRTLRGLGFCMFCSSRGRGQPSPGLVTRGAAVSNLRPVGTYIALFVLRKCHNWKTIELSP